MSALRTALQHSLLAALAEMEANQARHLVYDRAHRPDETTKALAAFYETQRAAAAERCDELRAKMEAVPF